MKLLILMINRICLEETLKRLNFTPEIYLFASCINKQFGKYVSYRPDPSAFAIDAFMLHWSNLNFYAFPPFRVIPLVLSKIQQEGATGVCVLPDWPTEAWYPKALQITQLGPIRIKTRPNLLSLPNHPSKIHPIWHKLNLIVCLLSGRS